MLSLSVDFVLKCRKPFQDGFPGGIGTENHRPHCLIILRKRLSRRQRWQQAQGAPLRLFIVRPAARIEFLFERHDSRQQVVLRQGAVFHR